MPSRSLSFLSFLITSDHALGRAIDDVEGIVATKTRGDEMTGNIEIGEERNHGTGREDHIQGEVIPVAVVDS